MNPINNTTDYALNTSNVLVNYGGIVNNDLKKILDQEDDPNLQIFSSGNSLYYDLDGVEHFLADHVNEFCILSLNIQSLHSKFDEFRLIIENLQSKSLYQFLLHNH